MVILHLFVYVQFIIHFMLLALIYAHPGACPSVLAWLTLASAKQARTSPHATVFLQGQNNHTPYPLYAAIPVLQLCFNIGNQQLLAIQMTNTWTSTVDRDT